jgi:hypothetical protein
MKESTLQRNVRKKLESEIGGYWFKLWGSKFQPAGLPDLCCVLLAVEVKRPGEETSEIQDERHDQIRRSGGIVVTATNPDEAVELVRAALRRAAPRPRLPRSPSL